jgi:hypothetical protein
MPIAKSFLEGDQLSLALGIDIKRADGEDRSVIIGKID